MLNQYLPVISAIIVAIITFVGNYYINRLKTTVDTKTLATNANDALRDDLLQIVDRYEKREQFLTDRVDKLTDRVDKSEATKEELHEVIRKLRDEIIALRTENQSLRNELQQTRLELEKFERMIKEK